MRYYLSRVSQDQTPHHMPSEKRNKEQGNPTWLHTPPPPLGNTALPKNNSGEKGLPPFYPPPLITHPPPPGPESSYPQKIHQILTPKSEPNCAAAYYPNVNQILQQFSSTAQVIIPINSKQIIVLILYSLHMSYSDNTNI